MLTLHHCSRSRSMRTLWLLNELGLDFELHTMPLDLKILRSPEYLAIHGFQAAVNDSRLTGASATRSQR